MIKQNDEVQPSHFFFKVHLHTWKTVNAPLWIQQMKGVLLGVFLAFMFFI